MNKFGIEELKNLFVEADNYEQQEDSDLEDENDDKNDFKLLLASNDSNSTICKVYDPYKLSHDKESPESKKDMSWYKQLMLFRESFLLRRFNHPAIAEFKGLNLYNSTIKFYEDGEDAFDEYYDEEDEDHTRIQFTYTNPTIFLEYISKGSLNQYIIERENSREKSEFLTPAQRQICILGLTAAVSYLHSNNIIHRSINPKTIWLDENYYPKLFDFSTTREMEQESENDQTKIYPDSLFYIAPEIMNGAENPSNYDNSIDIFALGRIIYFLITGFQPFKYRTTINGTKLEDPNRSHSVFTYTELLLKGSITPFLPDSIPPELQKFLLRCWDFNPHERPTATELLYHFLNDDDCLISELTDPDDINEYNQYKEKIIAFDESQINFDVTNKSFELSTKKSFEFEEFLDDEESIKLNYYNIEQEKICLEKIIKSKFNKYNVEEVFKLLLQMVKDGSIMEADYLENVIDYVNRQNLKNFSPAEAFLKSIFGDYIIDSRETQEISADLLKSKKSIKQANIPPWVTKIKKGAFKGFEKLEQVNIPNSVKVIDDEAFLGCSKLKFVNIPPSIEKDKLGKKAFMNCTSLKYIKTPHNLSIIKEATFKNDKALQKVDLNESLKVIEKEAFYNCVSLVAQKIPTSVSKIGRKAFEKDKS